MANKEHHTNNRHIREKRIRHITGKGIAWSIYWVLVGSLLFIGINKRLGNGTGDSLGGEIRVGSLAEEEVVGEVEIEVKEQVFTVTVLPQTTPKPEKKPKREIEEYPRDYELKDKEVDRIAQLLWSSPLRDSSAKKTLVWVVLNRVDDESGLFGDSIEEVVKSSEFSFFNKKAHISDRNREIVREVMQQWRAEKDGWYVGEHCPKNGLYVRFEGEDNRGIEVTGIPGGAALEW